MCRRWLEAFSELMRSVMPDFSLLNETDVREVIVRPFLNRLGYGFDADAIIRTEVSLSYSHAFLGHKKLGRDPLLSGRADYIFDVISSGRWVVEVKGPNEELSDNVVHQAHTYAAHPEIAAFYFLITNGHSFRLFQTGSLAGPMLEWSFDQEDANMLKLRNILGPNAIRKRARMVLIDPGQPLGEGLASRLRIIGGKIFYDQLIGSHPLLNTAGIEGLELPVTGGSVSRDEDGRIHAEISIANVAPLMRSFGASGLADKYIFLSSTKYLSQSSDDPTIFQNFMQSTSEAGTPLTISGVPFILPFEISFSALTETIGFLEGEIFQGTMTIDVQLNVSKIDPLYKAGLLTRFGQLPEESKLRYVGRFSVSLLTAL
jgi:hypothetical protein